jgi:sugar/nucleoside kinase (ribokinase family)
MAEYDLLVAGEINPDLILNGKFNLEFGQAEELVDDANLTIGSSSAIFACGTARLGVKTGFAGVCGDDLFGRFMLEEMQKRRVDTANIRIVQGGATGLTVILNRGADRMILTHPGLISTLRAEDVTDELLSRARHLHVAGYFIQDALRPGLPALFDRAHGLGLTTSLDTNYDPSEQWVGMADLLTRTDIFFPNEKEARSITHCENPDEALRALARSCRMIAMKCGEAGAKLAARGEIFETGSIPSTVIDTVGAGDSFDAGFIYAFLNGWKEPDALRLAAVCGSISTRMSGGTRGQATLAEAMTYMKTGK